VRWERIQLVFAFDGDVPALMLRQEDGGTRTPPTRQWSSDGVTYVRFNVLTAGDQRPLDAGRWFLADASGDAVASELAGDSDAGLATARDRRLALQASTYRVQTMREAATGRLVLDVALEGRERARSSSRIPRPVTRAWKRLRAAAWRGAFRLTRRIVRRGKPVVLFATRLSPRLTGNLEVVHDRMVARGLDERYRLVTLFTPAIIKKLGWPGRVRLLIAMAGADVIFLDDSFYPVYWVEFTPDVRIVQLWHASGAFKTVGYSRSASAGNPPFNPYGRVHKNTTHVIVSSDFDVPFYAEALGVPEDRVHSTGIPRMDRYFDPAARDAAIAAAHGLFPQLAGRSVWLFAPTYRGERVAEATYDLSLIDLAGLHAVAVEKNAVILFKHHPFVHERLDIPDAFRDRLVEASDADIDVNDLLFSVDLVITDYSSIVFEFSVLDRPMLFFVPDLEQYIAERDFYVEFEEFVPGRIVRTFDELLDSIRRDDYEIEKVAAFARKHFAHLDGNSTDRVIDLAIGG
jgi:CDP-ribitol ribitolphosphotransferase